MTEKKWASSCATQGCKGKVERPLPCIYCEECCYDQIGEEIERHPIGAVYAAEIKRGHSDP